MSDRFSELEFQHIGSESETADFVTSINRALDSHKGKYCEKFLVRFEYNEFFASDVDAWIEFCVKKEVKNFTLAIDSPQKYTLSQIMYSNFSLTTLHLEGCTMACARTIGWQSLTLLCLKDVVLNQSTIDEILFGCPLLRDMELQGCRGFSRLEINSPCVDFLKIEESESEDETFLEISAPYVRTLNITVFPHRRNLLLKNISSVVLGVINFFEYDVGSSSEQLMRNAGEFLENFNHVKKIHIERHCFEVVSLMAVNGWQLPQFRLEYLTVVSCVEYEYCVSGIIGLLESSPNLETLVLKGYGTKTAFVNINPATEDDLGGRLLHLKTIKFDNFTNQYGEPMITLSRILLKRAIALEEMAIEIDDQDKMDILKIAYSLGNCCRSSPRARIKLS